MHAEIPNEAVHAFFAQQFSNGVFTRLQRSFGRELDPSLWKLLSVGGNNLLFLTGFSVYGNLDCAHDSFITLHLCAHDAEAVPRKLRIRLLTFLLISLIVVRASTKIDVDRGQRCVNL